MVAQYEPQDTDRCIACQVGDVIFVKKPFVFSFTVCIAFYCWYVCKLYVVNSIAVLVEEQKFFISTAKLKWWLR